MDRAAKSMEAALDEERLDVLALLEASAPRKAMSITGRSPSPYGPRSPVRSMLDVDGDVSAPPAAVTNQPATKSPPRPAPAVRSMLDVDSPSQPAPIVRSMLDVDSPVSPPQAAMKQVFSNPTSPVDSSFRAASANRGGHPRSLSDAATRPADFGPRSSANRLLSPDPTLDYQFSDIITQHTGAALPKRVSQAPWRGTANKSSMAEVMQSLGQQSGVRISNKSKSPRGRLSGRSSSPGVGLLQPRHLSPAGRAVVAESQGMNFDNAYRRLSDANMARSGGSLSGLGWKKRSEDLNGSGRLAKSYFTPDGEELPEEESSDDHGGSSSDDEDGDRGRKAARSFNPSSPGEEEGPSSPGLDAKRKTLSLLAAAEEERIEVAAKQPAYKYRSLLDDPEITVTGPSGAKVRSGKGGVHPATSFDQPPEDGTRTPVDSDTEADLTDIKRAQKLGFAMTHVMSYPESHRAIRIIHRGEYSKIAQDMEAEDRRLRKYLVATDLSDESTHALEWAIGTVLRDGDTMIAIYCVDEEVSISATEAARVPDDPKAMREQAAAINVVTSSKAPVTPSGVALPLQHFKPSPLARAADKLGVSPSPAPSSRERTKAEDERMRAVEDITNRVEKLLRKTRLQVRVIVEVLHCKNPRHLITEVIDLVNPTLVILGSRGRSALKG
jgi:nucleotide-binding universal stress UspA family protein